MFDETEKFFIQAEKGSGQIICYQSNNSNNNIINLLYADRNLIEGNLLKYGGVLFRNFDISSVSEFNKLANILCTELFEYVYRSTPRTKLGAKIYTATEYPSDKVIPFHNENSYTKEWPDRLLFFSVIVADYGGETALADSRQVYNKLDNAIIDEFNKKKVLYVRNYAEGIDLPWQEVFQTNEKKEVEKYCNNNSLMFEWKKGNIVLTTKQICQATIKHPITNEDVWFNQAHLFHPSSLKKEDKEELIKVMGYNNLSRNVFYGDESEIQEDSLNIIREAYEKERIQFAWKKGDVLLLDNRLMAHSRNPYSGNRKVVVAMGK